MARPRILVAEDHINVAMDILRRLQRLGYDVAAIVSTGQEAVHKALETRPDLVLMDLGLPGGMDGVEAAKQIREHFEVPTIYLTAHVDDQTLHRAKVTEPHGFLLKPFEDRELHATIEMALYKHQMEKKLQASEQRYRVLYTNTPAMMHSIDENYRLLDVSEYWLQVLGYDRVEVIGRTVTDFLTEESRRYAEEVTLPEFMKTGHARDVPYQFVRKDGATVDILLSAFSEWDADGKFVRSLAVLTDVTERKRAQQAQDEINTALANAMPGISRLDSHGRYVHVNEGYAKMLGYEPEEMLGMSWEPTVHPNDRNTTIAALQRMMAEGKAEFEAKATRKDGTIFYKHVLLVKGSQHNSEPVGHHCFMRDITERKRAEAALRESEERAQRQYQDLQALHRVAEAVNQSLNLQEVLQTAIKSCLECIDVEAGIIRLLDDEGALVIAAHMGINEEYLERVERLAPEHGISATTISTKQPQIISDIAHDPRFANIVMREGADTMVSIPIMERERVLGVLNIVSHGPRHVTDREVRLLTAIGQQVGLAIMNARLFEEMEWTNRRRLALNQVAQTVNQSLNLQEVLEAALDATLKAVEVEGGNIRLWDEKEGALRMAAYRGMSEGYINQRRDFRPGEGVAGKVFQSGETFLVEDMAQYPHLNEMAQQEGVRSVASIPIRSRDKMVGVMSILSHGQRRFLPPEIELLTAIGNQIGTAIENARLFESVAHGKRELERSNQELEQFAYVASHDLQEPLRMVSNYVRLLARRYKGKFDTDADEFIEYAVDGAKRMQSLIQDLLAFSRVGTRGKHFEPTDCERVLEQTLANLQVTMEECGAVVTYNRLPTIRGDRTQLGQLFQNLIVNAIKFRGEHPPAVHVESARQDGAWVFSVRDNGIGIEPEHAERIFLIFQRLHHKTEYPGTGMGLPICKRIVERHGGRIWTESAPGKGTTFYFTIPDKQ